MAQPNERIVVGILVILMLLTGTVNTIATKYQDIVCVKFNEDGSCKRYFEHFAVQSAEMFLGEVLCLIPCLFGGAVYDTQDEAAPVGHRFKSVLAFALPALCDVTGSTLLNVGIFFTYPSVYQMLRGTVVFFAGFFTISLLGRKLSGPQWFALVLIVFGAAIVGSVSVIHFGHGKHNQHNDTASNPLLGNILVVSAQVAAAFQFIIEEKYLSRYRVKPNVAVGLEGCWGLLTCMMFLPLLAQLRTSSGEPFDSLSEAIEQIKQSRQLQIATIGSILSIAFFNFFGITLTKKLSGAARATIDACRTLFVWMYSLHVGWEEKSVLKNMIQVIGFVIMVSGTSLFNGLISAPKRYGKTTPKRNAGSVEEPLLSQPANGVPLQFSRKYMSSTMVRSLRLGRSLLGNSPSTSFTSQGKNEESLASSFSSTILMPGDDDDVPVAEEDERDLEFFPSD